MKIPFGQVEMNAVSVGPPPLANPADAAAASSGGALIGIGAGIGAAEQVGEHMLRARDSVNVSNSLTDAQSQLADYRLELEKDPDTAGREAKFRAKSDEVRRQYSGKFNTTDGINSFDIRFNQLFRPMQLQVKQQARDEELQNFKIDLSDSLDKLATQSVFAKTDSERNAIQEEATKSIYDAVRTGRLHATDAMKFKKAYLGRVDGALAQELVRTNPGAAITALGDPDKFPMLDAAQRVQLRSQAQQRSESLGVQARAELRADAQEFMGDLQRAASGGPMPSQDDLNALLKRAGPKSAEAVRLKKSWDFYSSVNAESDGKSIPELTSRIGELNRGTQGPGDVNLKAADAEMHLTPQERALYQRHLGNVVGPGGVNNADGSRSTLYQTSFERDGRTYNVPTVWDGKILSPDEAIKRADQQGLDQFPSYGSEAEAEARYKRMHDFMEKDIPHASPQDLHAARVLQTALARKVAERDKDPAAYALKSYPTIAEQLQNADTMEKGGNADGASDVRRQAWNALIDAQRREGTPDYKLSLLTHDAEENLRQKFLTTDGQARVDLVDQLRNQFGDQWGRVQQQLWKDKPAPADVQVLGSLPPGANLPKVEIAEAMKITDKQADEVLGTRVKAINDAVRTAGADMRSTMTGIMGGPGFAATYQHAAEKLAQLYAMRNEGDDVSAARRALDRVFYDHFDVVNGRAGYAVQVPKIDGQPIVPAADVRSVQNEIEKALPKLELALPGRDPRITDAAAKDMLVRTVRSTGYWATTGDNQGMALMVRPGVPVLFADGKPLVVPFDSVRSAAAIRQAGANLANRELLNMGAVPSGQEPVDLGGDPGEPAAGVSDVARFFARGWGALGTPEFRQAGGTLP